MPTNLRLTGAATGPREESDLRMNYGNVQQIICASTNLSGTQPMSYSTDGGGSWNQSSLPAAGGTTDVRQGDPTIDWTSDGTAWSATLGIDATTTILKLRFFKSSDQGKTWTFDSTVANAQTSVDREALWIDHSQSSTYKDNMYLIWHNNAPCFVAVRQGAGGAWGAAQQISGSETTGTAIGSDIKTNANGDVFAFWPDTGSQNLYVAKSTNGGTTFGTPVTIATTFGSGFLGIPAQDDRLALIYLSGAAYRTATEDLVYAIWFDLSGDSGCDSAGDDPGSDVTSTCKARIWFSRSVDGGAHWETARKINDQNALNDQFFPRLALDEATGVLMVVYYDTINNSNRLKTDLWMQRSYDNGQTWTGATQVTTAETDETASSAQLDFQYGDYIGLTGYDGNFFACWTDRRNGGLEEIWGAPMTTTSIQIALQKSTYSKDEVSLSDTFAPAYWLEVSGFSNAELNLNDTADLSKSPNPAPTFSVTIDPSLNPTLSMSQIAGIASQLSSIEWSNFGPAPIVPTDPTLQTNGQTFFYPYTVVFPFPGTTIFGELNPDQSAILTMTATLKVGQITRTDSANIELTSGENPFFEDLNPAAPASYPSWLSFDLRFFKIAVPNTPGATATRFGATMTKDPSEATGFIATAIANLTAGKGSYGGDGFDALSEDEESTTIEYLPQDASSNYVFNFAVARVRLKGSTPGAQAKKVRVFFRLFNAQTTASNFDTSTTYRYQSDGVLFGVTVPLLGVQNDEYVTVPCFAVPRVNLSAPADMKTQPEDTPNAYTINVDPGVEVDSFFGCWLDVNQPQQKLFPLTPPAKEDGPFTGTLHSLSEMIAKAPHQCLIAEIRYDDTPIPPNADSSNSDKLAQRNIGWIDGPNPGTLESRRMPHPFDVRATPPSASSPDEILVFWGNTPQGSTAYFYLPALNAGEIVRLANGLYGAHRLTVADGHTIACPVGGATLIPIPNGTARNAGLLTVDLSTDVRRGDEYRINVLQLTEGRATVRPLPPPPPPPQISAPRQAQKTAQQNATAEKTYTWRRMLGAFQIAIAIKPKAELLAPEERLLAWLRWINETIPLTNRWYPVFQRYLWQIAGRVAGFGGNPGTIKPSPTGGIEFPSPAGERGICFTGKVIGVIYDRFGDFEGFELLTEGGDLRLFRGREPRVEELVRDAWAERTVIAVCVTRDEPEWPATILLKRLS